MSTIFPGSASVNQIFQGYRYNGEKWELIGIDLTADYPEILEGKISASVIPDIFATTDYVDQEVGNVDFSSASVAFVPTGGTAGQVLSKIDENDYNTQWVAQSGGGASYEITASTSAPTGGSDGDIWFRHL